MVDGLKPTLPAAFASVAGMLPSDIAWTYEATLRGGYITHTWIIRGPRGGIHVWARPDTFAGSRREWAGGIEGHSPIPQSEYASPQPSHAHCWVLHGPCWHDGSSLQFSEIIAPCLPQHTEEMRAGDHGIVLCEMLHRYRIWLPTLEEIEAARQEPQS